MIWLLLMIASIGICNAAEGDDVAMTCTLDSSYTAWGAYSNKYKNYYFLSGQRSYSDKQSWKRDRLFKWDYCRPQSDSYPYDSTSSLSQTNTEQSWSKYCGSNSALIAAKSTYANKITNQDREWDFKCAKLDPAKFVLGGCTSSGYVNWVGDSLDYKCPSNGVLIGITTSWISSILVKNDRQWNFHCCRIQEPASEYPELTCVDDVVSVELGTEEEATGTPSYFIKKQETYHNDVGDVIMVKWGYCDVNIDGDAAIDTVEPKSTETLEDGAWSATCSHLNDGNAAVIGDQIDDGDIPIHRQFECGLLDDSKYVLVDCEESLTADEDSTVFSCPDNGVFRSYGYTHNADGTNDWAFECCKIEKVYQYSQSFSVPDMQEIVNGLRVNVVYVYAIGFVLCLLMVVNIGLMAKSMCSKKSNRYKVVSMQSTDEEI